MSKFERKTRRAWLKNGYPLLKLKKRWRIKLPKFRNRLRIEAKVEPVLGLAIGWEWRAVIVLIGFFVIRIESRP